MLRSKSFVKVTKKGSVVNVVKEHYLRDDICCRVASCTACSAPTATEQPMLSLATARTSTLFPSPHYLVPDTNIFLHQMDAIERGPFANVIVLQTVLEEVKHRNMSIYKRLRALVAQTERAFVVFSNENHRETFVEKEKCESPNDRNDRAIRVAARWYNHHMQTCLSAAEKPLAIYLTDDTNSRLLAAQESPPLPAVSLRAYIKSLTAKDSQIELLDMLSAAVASEREAQTEAEQKDTDDAARYSEYLPLSQLESGIQTGAFLKGHLNVSPLNTHQGTVTLIGSDGKLETLSIRGRRNMNRALQGDTVVLQLLPKSQWPACLHDSIADSDSESDSKDCLPARPGSHRTARVVGLLARNKRHYSGSLVATAEPPESRAWLLFKPMDRRVPIIRLRSRSDTAALEAQRLVVAVDDWPPSSKRPLGHLVRSIGPIDDPDAATLALLLEYEVPGVEPFPHAALDDLPSPHWTAQPEPGRVSLLSLSHITCSVDPLGCTDIDDALHAQHLPSGNYQVGVHIADVSAFVRPHTALDAVAALRSTSVYLADRRIDMLPPLLGSGLCSLQSHADRYAVSVLWELDADAQIVSTTFQKSIIRSSASLTYGEAQSRLFDAADQTPLTQSLRTLSALAQKLRAQRTRQGALNLASLSVSSPFTEAPEIGEEIRGESASEASSAAADAEAHSLVEEFMLLANTSVASFVARWLPATCLLRLHPAPCQGAFDSLQASLASRALSRLQTQDSLSLNASLESAAAELAASTCMGTETAATLLRLLTTRALRTAQYAPATPGISSRHYGLAAAIYTHFTSPIRRYADLVVHRLLAEAIDASRAANAASSTYPTTALQAEPRLYTHASLESLCANMNHRHKMAQLVSRHSAQAAFYASIKSRILTGDAHVLRILTNGLVILFYAYGVEGCLAFDSRAIKRHKDTIYHDPDRMAWIHKGSDQPMLRVFDRLQVAAQIHRVGSECSLVFEWLDAPQAMRPLLKPTTMPKSCSSKRKGLEETPRSP